MAIVIALAMMIGVLALTTIAINAFPTQRDFALKSKVQIVLSALALATFRGARYRLSALLPSMTTGSSQSSWRTGLSEYARGSSFHPLASII